MKYTDDFQPDFGILWPRYEARDYDEESDESLKGDWLAKKKIEELAQQDPVQFGWVLESWNEVNENWRTYKNHVICGGNRCLRGDSLIYDPVLGIERRIDSIDGPHHVLAWNGKEVVIAEAEKPFTKPAGPMVRVVLSTGESFVAAQEHRVFSSAGSYISCQDVRPGFGLFLPRSNSDICLSVHGEDGRRCSEKPLDFQDDCRHLPRSHGEQPHLATGSDLDGAPSQVGAATHISTYDNNHHLPFLSENYSGVGTQDDLGNIPSNSRASRVARPRSIQDALHHLSGLFSDTQFRASYIPCKLVSQSREDRVLSLGDQQYAAASGQFESRSEFHQSGKRCDYGVAYVESVEEAGIEVKWDMTVPAHGNYIQSGIVHHNSGKTSYAARLVVWMLMNIPECRIRCYQVNGDKSIKEQQAYVWEALPEKYKTLSKKKGDVHNIQYTQRGGFVDRQLILPAQEGYKRGSECIFGDYQQYRNDPQIVEGWWAHLVWCDEEVPQKMYERLLTRLYDARGRMLLTFTTIQGWSNLVADILGRTKTLRTRRSTLLKRLLPVAQESLTRASTRIYYFWTQDNPFIPPETVDSFKGRPENEILAIAHGIPTKSSTAKFPNFDEQIHVIPHDKLPWIRAELEGLDPVRVTNYHIIDPSGSKPWSMIWISVTQDGKIYIYRDWPDIGYGPWGESCENPEGRRGPAQKDNRFGITDYVEMVAACEGNEPIFERLIDPRMAASSRPGQDGATSIQSELEDAGMTVVPAPGLKIDHGLALINDRLRYDTTKPMSGLNCPRLYISDRCEQVIECFKNYTGCSRDEVWKDFIDCVRMGLEAGLDFVEAENKTDTGKTFTW